MDRNYRANQSYNQLNVKYTQGSPDPNSGRVYPYQQTLPELQLEDLRKQKLQQDYLLDYREASYERALQFYFENSYREKLISGDFRKLDMFGDSKELKLFGVGIYLYIELIRRLGWIFLLFSLVSVLPIYLNVSGSGLSSYSVSYGTYLIITSLGNYSKAVTEYDPYIQAGVHCLINLLFFIFFLFWKAHRYSEMDSFENDNDVVHPQRFCVEIGGLPKKGVKNEELEQFFQVFGPVYECSIVYDYRDKLKYFQQIDEIDQEIKEEELQIKMGGGDLQELKSLKETKNELVKNINSMKISPHILSAFVHFEYEKSKTDMLNYYSDHWMFDSCSHDCVLGACNCCMEQPEEKYLFQGQRLKILSAKVENPEQINWESADIGYCNKICRIIFAFFIIIIFIAICSTLVGLCSIFISVNSINCDGVTIPTYAQASLSTNSTEVTCFCNSNLFSLNDQSIANLCRQIFKKLYVENGLQIVAAIISIITNALFSVIVRRVIEFTKPKSHSSALISKTIVLFLFLIINTCILPLLIYADAFGFKIASYVSLIKLISPNIGFFNMDNFTYYSDFSAIWYRNVSPYFVNFLVINAVLIWGKFLLAIYLNSRRVSNLEEKEKKILQRHMNNEIVSYQVDVVGETAQLLLIVFLSLMYNAGLPVIVVLGALNIISMYVSNKYLIVRYSKRIEGLNEDFSALSQNILPFSILFSSLFGIWMLTASSYIYPNAMKVMIPGTEKYMGVFELFPRLFYISFTLIMAIIVLFYILFYNLVVRFFSWLGSLCYESKEVVTKKPVSFTQATRTLNVLHSYNIHSNPKYKNAILNLERYLEDE